MNNFDYYAPTKVVFGKDTEKETGRLVKEQGASSDLFILEERARLLLV